MCSCLLVWTASPVGASSLFYSFTSGDVLDKNYTATYGLGRIDFVNGVPVPQVVLSGDKRQHGLTEFTRNGVRYICDSKVQKPNENVKYYDVYSSTEGIANKLISDFTVSVTPNPVASCDLSLAPDAEGIIYSIEGTTLKRHDLLNGTTTATVNLDSGYNVYSLVGLTNNANVLYVWASNRTNISTDTSYTPISSDIFIYDRSTLAKKAHFPFVRTGLDITGALPDDPTPGKANTPVPGRGLVDINNVAGDKSTVLVVYNNASSKAANVIRINEETVSYDVIITSADLNGFNIDTESPIPDQLGGFYLGCYSGDPNAEPGTASKDSVIYHWDKTHKLASLDVPRAQTTADLVLKAGTYLGHIMLFSYTGASVDIGGKNYQITPYLWDGANNKLTKMTKTSGDWGVELGKPFSDGSDGIYFMMERFIGSDDLDALMHWNPSENEKEIAFSTTELEIENPPSDGNVGFYYVASDLIGSKDMYISTHLYHCIDWKTSIDHVCSMGSFDVPKSALSGDYNSTRELIQNESGFFEDTQHSLFFVGAGPIGGGQTLNVFTWNATTKAKLVHPNHLVKNFTDKDLGGYASVATMVYFTETSSNGGVSSSGGGCTAGITGALALGLVGAFVALRKKN